MDNSWKEEARGIPPWPGAHVHHCLLGDDRTDIVTWLVDKPGFENWRVESYVTGFHLDTFGGSWADVPMVLALDNPDTCAAFMRRLAVRLGCPEEVAEIGTMFYEERREPGTWVLAAGGRRGGAWEWWCELVSGMPGTDNRLLALVRAWRSVGDG